jgi:hypothetical protein
MFLIIFVSFVVITFLFILNRWRKYPEKSFKNNAISILLNPLRVFKLGPYKHGTLNLEGLIKSSMKKAKLTDFGDITMQFAKNYKLIMDSAVHKSQVFSNIGYISAELEMKMSWVRRLKFVQYLKDTPAVLDVPVPGPLFVMGLPRTGTTYLHRLLSLDPASRAPLLWELINPVPIVGGDSTAEEFEKDRIKRNKYGRALIEKRRSMGDSALAHIHEIDADLPEECIMALNDEIPVNTAMFYSGYMNAETFFNKIPAEPAYKWYKKYLKLLSWQVGEKINPRRWTLKCPLHLFYVKEIAAAFPDAKLIWTHRHPVSAVPSLCSLLKAFHSIYYEKEGRDDSSLGHNTRDVSAKFLLKTPKDIEESGLDCAHCVYNDLIKDPITMIKSIYKQFGWKYTEEYEKLLNDYITADKKKRQAIKELGRGKGDAQHTYSPEEFGLTESELIGGDFETYCNMFNVPMSKN